jgi:hypothetical protein
MMSPKHLELALREIFRARRSSDAIGSELLRKQPRRDRSEGKSLRTARACYPRPTAPLSSVDTRLPERPVEQHRTTVSSRARPNPHREELTLHPVSPLNPLAGRDGQYIPDHGDQTPDPVSSSRPNAQRDTTLILVLSQLALPPFPQTLP